MTKSKTLCFLFSAITALTTLSEQLKNLNFNENIDVDSINKINEQVVVTNGTLVFKSNDTNGDSIDFATKNLPNGMTFHVGDDGKLQFLFDDEDLGGKAFDRIIINGKPLFQAIDERIDEKMSSVTPSSMSNLVQNMVYNPLWGKKLAIIGDSLTVSPSKNESWGAFIAQRNRMIMINNGRGGEQLCLDGEGNKATINSYTNDIPNDSDFILCQIGANDQNNWWSTNRGEDTDLTTTSFKGCWNLLLIGLKNNYPNAKIGIILANNWTENLGTNSFQVTSPGRRQMTQWQKIQCQRFNIPVFDPVDDTRWYTYHYGQYLVGGNITSQTIPTENLEWYDQIKQEMGTDNIWYKDRIGAWVS